MTRQTFYRALRKAAPSFRWVKEGGGFVMGIKNGDSYCFLSAVYQYRNPKSPRPMMSRYEEVGQKLGLNDKDIQAIASAASRVDSDSKQSLVRVRKTTLKCVGLVK